MKDIVNFSKKIELLKNQGVYSEEQMVKSYNTGDFPEGMILSHNEKESHIKPSFITAKNIDHLKELCGVDDSQFTEMDHKDERTIPPAFHEVKEEINDPRHPHICNAMNAYVFGNSKNVSTWKEKINEMRFPQQVAVFSADTINVQAGKPLTLDGSDAKPFGLVCNQINIEPNGQIISKGPGNVTCDTFNAAQDTTLLLNLLSIGGDGGNGGNGGDGGHGGKGVSGSSATPSGKSGCNSAGKGGKGKHGGDGTSGGRGGNGSPADEINYNVTTMNGTYTIGSIGGNGGDGGRGGNGGDGGDGGHGGDACRSCGTGQLGDGGNGGGAANGGDGNDGGNGKKVYINYQSGNPTFNTPNQSASGGKGGDAGSPGSGGSGTNSGNSGATALAGKGGKGGNPGQIIINGSPQ